MKKFVLFLFIFGSIMLILVYNKWVSSESKLNDLDLSKNTKINWERSLWIDITMSKENNYNNAFAKAKELWISFVPLSLSWDDIEISKNNYKNDYLSIANSFYPKNNTKLALNISPIDTNNLRLPKDLKNKEFNDKEVIDRFKKVLDYIISETKDIDFVSISIWNEIDSYLWNDKEKWKGYEIFFKETSQYLKSKKKWIKVWTKIRFDSLDKYEIKSINKYSDVLMITYYPLNADFTVKNISNINKDFEKLKKLFPKKEIQILELWYPSWKYTNSSEDKQSKFFSEVFKSWDKNKDVIKVINIDWLHDKSQKDIEYFEKYYWLKDKVFADFLWTLWIMNNDWTNKKSFDTIKKEIKLRSL